MNGFRFERHPNGVVFSDVKTPDFDTCITFVKTLAQASFDFQNSPLGMWLLAKMGNPC